MSEVERRRFFPARRVQQVPGQRVELEMQLRAEAPAPAPVPKEEPPAACECDVDGPALLPDWHSNAGTVLYSTQHPEFGHVDNHGNRALVYRMRNEGGRVVRAAVQIDTFEPTTLRAVLLGRTLVDVAWTWEIDAPDLPYNTIWSGVEVQQDSHSVGIKVLTGDMPMGDIPSRWRATLTLRASCGGKPAGQIVLQMGCGLWQSLAIWPDD